MSYSVIKGEVYTMLNITKNEAEKALCICLEGKLDTVTSPDLEDSIKESIEGKEELILDFENLSYVSSAGLRVLLAVQKIMNGCGGTMKVLHVNQEIMDIFDVTGFADILTIDNSEDEKCCEEKEECCEEEKE